MSARAICIAGDAGSGKTTAAREAAARLPGWRVVTAGERFRAYCREHGLDPAEIASLPDEFHREADEAMRQLLAEAREVIVEGRVVGWLAAGDPTLLRVWCEAPVPLRAERYAAREGMPVDAARAEIVRRDRRDYEKFRRLYGIDYRDPAFFDLRLDTGTLTRAEVGEAILAALRDP